MEDYDDLSTVASSANYFKKLLIDPFTNDPVSALGSIDTTNGGIPGSKPPNTGNTGELIGRIGCRQDRERLRNEKRGSYVGT